MESHEHRDRFIELLRELRKHGDGYIKSIPPPAGLLGVVTHELTKQLGGRDIRIAFYKLAFDPFLESGSELAGWQKLALVSWARPTKQDNGSWTFDKQFMDDCFIIKTILMRYTQ